MDPPSHHRGHTRSGSEAYGGDALEHHDSRRAPPGLELAPISSATYAAANALVVKPEQAGFVAPIGKTLADADTYPECLFRLAIVAGQPVGYLLLRPAHVDDYRVVSILRLMIDGRYQGRGFGRQLLASALAWIDTFVPPVDLVRISAVPRNQRALLMYERAGFQRMGIEDGEIALYKPTAHTRVR